MDITKTIRTPQKHNRLVLEASYQKNEFDSHAVDCPFPFFWQGKYWMTYVGWDAMGYQTGLACSSDLLNWEKEGLILKRGPKGSVTEYNVALTSILRDNNLFGQGALKRVDGRFIGTYHAYPEPGFESGPAVIGLCSTDDLHSWDIGEPVLTPDPSCHWEAGGLYKSWLMESDGTYYLFYNAKNKESPWIEQTGLAKSSDLSSWERHPCNPVLKIGSSGDFDDRYASDPVVLYNEKDQLWLMFYFGLCSDGYARNSVAYSDNLINWKKSGEILINVGSQDQMDSRFAHKPGIIAKDGILYHFYCAVGPSQRKHQDIELPGDMTRGISVATSQEVEQTTGLNQ